MLMSRPSLRRRRSVAPVPNLVCNLAQSRHDSIQLSVSELLQSVQGCVAMSSPRPVADWRGVELAARSGPAEVIDEVSRRR